MTIKIITAFPGLFCDWVSTSIVSRAQQKGLVSVRIIDLRSYAMGKHRQIDDEAYGGGGMVMQVAPIVRSIRDNTDRDSLVCLLTPQGSLWTQQRAKEFAKTAQDKNVILISGRYEGVDARIENFVDEFISIGDYVVTGGELPSMIVAETIIRLVPGVINEKSLTSESFNDGLLDYSVYTKPQVFEGFCVPEVYLSGNHRSIEQFRFNSRLKNTQKHRPDLYQKYLDSKCKK